MPTVQTGLIKKIIDSSIKINNSGGKGTELIKRLGQRSNALHACARIP